ncbi:hypothetical protein KIN20_019686 [Parelaphostrongylus tenuis]|uniref:Uncharacterized protein n=1 Tax=Parelaphostrongylus tenuis TaxID=148309 RepID=A0AAD5QV72_PARTN|nr:hypothetical protein KIN20_019686 [Parelaphostrongylus tenuis]
MDHFQRNWAWIVDQIDVLSSSNNKRESRDQEGRSQLANRLTKLITFFDEILGMLEKVSVEVTALCFCGSLLQRQLVSPLVN